MLDQTPGLMDELDALLAVQPGSTRIRCHGDYHLGQVLRVDDDFVILDFEGEPARPLDARRRKETPLKDVVGMLRSFDYAASAALFQRTGDQPADFDRLAPWARLWAARSLDRVPGRLSRRGRRGGLRSCGPGRLRTDAPVTSRWTRHFTKSRTS